MKNIWSLQYLQWESTTRKVGSQKKTNHAQQKKMTFLFARRLVVHCGSYADNLQTIFGKVLDQNETFHRVIYAQKIFVGKANFMVSKHFYSSALFLDGNVLPQLSLDLYVLIKRIPGPPFSIRILISAESSETLRRFPAAIIFVSVL